MTIFFGKVKHLYISPNNISMKGGIKVLKRIIYKQSSTTNHTVSTDPQNYRRRYSSY
jgi:hypothetical protein